MLDLKGMLCNKEGSHLENSLKDVTHDINFPSMDINYSLQSAFRKEHKMLWRRMATQK